MSVVIGEFVEVEDCPHGIGKLLHLEDGLGEVGFFASPARGLVHRSTFDLARIRPRLLLAQTRVYWIDTERGSWLVGRVTEAGRRDGREFGQDEAVYLVDLPNDQFDRVPVSQLQVRWNHPVEDPVAYLAAQITETPYFHTGRQAFLRQVVAQRAACRSLTGLWSAAIDLEPHQLHAVHTVLTDPIQRYLLADEVGLGKTIEAGAVLRQFVLDEPQDHRAAVIAPENLLGQWISELEERFYLGSHLGDTIHVVSEVEELPPEERLGLLIVDEAHHAAAQAFSRDRDERRSYGLLAELARRTPRLLLLSATPVLRNEAGFLAMLHLLEPDAYPLDDPEAFRRRIQSRQELAEALGDLDPDVPLFLEDATDSLERLIRGDSVAEALIARLRACLDAPEEAPARKVIVELREHIGEVYRLHRRLIRHRRESLQHLLPTREGATVLRAPDPSRRQLGELLEVWREQANLHADEKPAAKPPLAGLYRLLLRALASHPLVLQELVEARLEGRPPDAARTPRSSAEEREALAVAEFFPREREILSDMLAAGTELDLSRVNALAKVVVEAEKRRTRTVLFVDAPGVADRVATALASRLPGRVLRFSARSSLAPFLDPGGSAMVLVCDRRAEEGLNLQTVKAQILHLDLPLDPGRLEQRLGRIDRLEARKNVSSFLFEEEEGLLEGWRRCLVDEIRVFDRSVASLQYVLEAQMQGFYEELFDLGEEALDRLSSRLGDADSGLEAEIRCIRMQEQLDSRMVTGEEEREWFQALEEFQLENDGSRKDFDAWVVDRLQFGARSERESPEIVRYVYRMRKQNRRRGESHQTLLAPDQFIRWCRESVDPGAAQLETRRLSFSRTESQQRGVELARIGHAFVDGIAELTRRDDRGAAHAMWRRCSGVALPEDPWLVLGFDFLVEAEPEVASLPQDLAPGSSGAIRRRLDALLPPRYQTVWIDQDLEPIEDPLLLRLLGIPYQTRDRRPRPDYNLSAERWDIVRPLLELGSWETLCVDAAKKAQDLLEERLSLGERQRLAEARIDEHLYRVRTQMKARLARLPPSAAAAEQRILELEEAFAEGARRAVRAPRLTPDSAFAVFLASFDPFRGLES